jgi:hypothetical protein
MEKDDGIVYTVDKVIVNLIIAKIAEYPEINKKMYFKMQPNANANANAIFPICIIAGSYFKKYKEFYCEFYGKYNEYLRTPIAKKNKFYNKLIFMKRMKRVNENVAKQSVQIAHDIMGKNENYIFYIYNQDEKILFIFMDDMRFVDVKEPWIVQIAEVNANTNANTPNRFTPSDIFVEMLFDYIGCEFLLFSVKHIEFYPNSFFPKIERLPIAVLREKFKM